MYRERGRGLCLAALALKLLASVYWSHALIKAARSLDHATVGKRVLGLPLTLESRISLSRLLTCTYYSGAATCPTLLV